MDLLTQWRTGPSGATGLDYTAIPVVLDMWQVTKPDERNDLFRDIKIMEVAALEHWRK